MTIEILSDRGGVGRRVDTGELYVRFVGRWLSRADLEREGHGHVWRRAAPFEAKLALDSPPSEA